MSLSMAFFTFLNAWFVMLFFVVPFFVKPAQTRSEVEYAAAPQALKWKKLLICNTLASLVVTAVLALIIHSHIFVIRDAVT